MSGRLDPDATVPDLLRERSRRTPGSSAFLQEDELGHWAAMTWGDFASRVEQLAAGLVAAGLRRGDRLALIAAVSLRWELVHHAALSIGVVVAGMDIHDLPERIAAMVELADIAAFAVDDPSVLAAVSPTRLGQSRFVLMMNDETAPPPDGLRTLHWNSIERTSRSAPPRTVRGSDDATIIFTSGTSGAPKAIAYTHAQLRLAMSAICEAFGFVGTHGRLLCWLPLSNLFQRIVNLTAIQQGAATYLLRDPRRVMDVVADVSPDVFIGVPRFYEKLHAGLRARIGSLPVVQRTLVGWAWQAGRLASGYRLIGRRPPPWLALVHAMAERLVLGRIRRSMGSRLRCLVSGSAPMPRPLLDELHALGWTVLEAYGLSENALPMAMNRPDACRFGTVGRPSAGNEIRIDTDGVVAVRGDAVFRGYLGDCERPPRDAEGWYRTGDLGEFDAAGYLRLTGRRSEIIKTSTGRRVAPVSLEARLAGISGVDQVVAIGDGRKSIAIVCSLDASAGVPIERIERELAARAATIIGPERPLGAVLVNRPFSIELGELTTNLKLRRAAIEELHAEAIERLYGELDRAGSSTAGSRWPVVAS